MLMSVLSTGIRWSANKPRGPDYERLACTAVIRERCARWSADEIVSVVGTDIKFYLVTAVLNFISTNLKQRFVVPHSISSLLLQEGLNWTIRSYLLRVTISSNLIVSREKKNGFLKFVVDLKRSARINYTRHTGTVLHNSKKKKKKKRLPCTTIWKLVSSLP